MCSISHSWNGRAWDIKCTTLSISHDPRGLRLFVKHDKELILKKPSFSGSRNIGVRRRLKVSSTFLISCSTCYHLGFLSPVPSTYWPQSESSPNLSNLLRTTPSQTTSRAPATSAPSTKPVLKAFDNFQSLRKQAHPQSPCSRNILRDNSRL